MKKNEETNVFHKHENVYKFDIYIHKHKMKMYTILIWYVLRNAQYLFY